MNILITGAGGAAAISIWKSLSTEHEIYMADIDPCAAGLYLVPALQRLIIPAGDSANFIANLLDKCLENKIQVLISTVDSELFSLSGHCGLFEKHHIHLPLSGANTLKICRDKYLLLEHCTELGINPLYTLLSDSTAKNWTYFPCIAKPRVGSGSRGVIFVADQQSLKQLPFDNSYLIQEYLPGEEYSVDVYFSSADHALAAVPRLRMKIDSGIAVASQTVINPLLSELAVQISREVGIKYVANIQFKADQQGYFKLLEINPRFPGTLPLTAAAGIDIPKLLISDLSGQNLGSNLLPFKELMVVRYWTEQFFSVEEWKTLCN